MLAIGHEAGTAPRWLELGGLVGALGLAVVGVVGLALAVAGRYDPWTTLAVVLPIVALASVWLARALPARPSSRSTTAAAIVAVAVAMAFAGFAASSPSQNVLVDRDPGSYTNTARGLVRDGSLQIDARGQAFANVSGLSFTSQAVSDVGPATSVIAGGPPEPSGHLEFQFNHMTSVVLATSYALGGRALMFRLPALAILVGLLLIYAVAVRACRRPWVALLAPAALAGAAPILYVSRNTYSEPFTLVPLWAAVLALTHFHRRPRVGLAVIGGVLLGATACVRVDAILYVALAVPLAGVSIASAEGDVARARRRGWMLAALAAVVPTAIGTYDLYRRSGGYVSDRGGQLSELYAGGATLALITVAGVVAWRRVPARRYLAARGQRTFAVASSGTVGLVLLAGWLVRPHVQTGHLGFLIPLVAQLQRRDGLRIDPYASYAEDSMRWMAWYVGPLALAVAIAAMAWLTYRALRGRAEPVALAVLVLCLGAGCPYWWSPSITPDQLWATRRFVPAVFPALAVMTVIGLAAAIEWANRRQLLRRPAALGPVLMATAVIAVLVPPALVTQPIQDQVMQRGFTRPLEQTCDFLPADAAVLVVGEASGVLLQQSVRSWCGMPTAREARPLSAAQVSAMADAVRTNGYRLYLVGQNRTELDQRVSSPAPPVFVSGAVTNDHNSMATLDHPPRSYGGLYTLQIFAVPAAF